MFNNLFYPDNEKRATRLTELVSDNSSSFANIANQSARFKIATKNANEAIKKAYGMKNVDIKFHDINFVTTPEGFKEGMMVANILSPMVTYTVASKAISKAMTAWLVRAGRIGEAAFVNLVGLPRWLNVGKIAGGIAAVVVVQGIIDAVSGAAQRSHLQEKIKESIKPRFEMKKAELANEEILSKINTVTTSLQVMVEVMGESMTEEKLDSIISSIISKNKVKLDDIDSLTRTTLDELDKSRGSFTSED